MYQIHSEATVDSPIHEVWKFLQNPRNLNEITPPNLQFEILSNPPSEMYNGLLIMYRVKIPLFGTQKWLTEIKHIREGKSFIDEQRVGPYKLWYHYHEVEAKGDKTIVRDTISYKLPLGVLGTIAHALVVKNMLTKIFTYREKKFQQLFAKQG